MKQQIPVDKKLVEIEICLSSIRFSFMPQVIEIGAPFQFVSDRENCKSVHFDPWKKSGDLNILWKLIDQRASHVRMDRNAFRLEFKSGAALVCPNQDLAPELVLVWEGESPGGGILLTRYPADL